MNNLGSRLSMLLCLFLVFAAGMAQAAIPTGERNALIALYDSAGGANWTDNSGWLGASGTECSWYGILCNVGETAVVQINLRDNGLVGTLPNSLSDLTSLGNLLLSGNQLTGNIPPALAMLSDLESLDLANNQLSGEIPPELGDLTKLRSITLWSNQLSGPIPPELANASTLGVIAAQDNQLSGPVPPELGNLTGLVTLYLSNNGLSGPLPSELGSLVNLSRLGLRGNQLSGEIPSSLINLTALTENDLRYNALHSEDGALLSHLNATSPEDLTVTQTLDADGLVAISVTEESVELAWNEVSYTQSGGYRVYLATSVTGPFTMATEISDKSIAAVSLSGLTECTTYYAQTRSFTAAHPNNANEVESDGETGTILEFTTTGAACTGNTASSTNGGGCSVTNGDSSDAGLALLLFIALCYLACRWLAGRGQS